MTETERKGWWGDYPVTLDKTVSWRIGPLTLRIQRKTQEWRISTERSEEAMDCSLELAVAEDRTDLREAADLIRIGTGHTTESIELHPRLADRAVVSRPDRPFVIPPKDEITVYVSTPLWLRICSSENVELLETPFHRPSDTWFGPNTREGEVCYASVTACRLELSEVPRRPHRALTPVRIINKAASPLGLERLSLPVKNLSLFSSVTGDLWTQVVTIERMPDQELTPATLGKTSPPGVAGAVQVAGPREEPPHNMVIRAFSSLFG